MAIRNPQVDAYIEAAPEFSRPILKRIRRAFHAGCPKITESMKWGCPHFEFNGIVGSMAAFKRHASFGFWKSKLMSDPHGILREDRPGSMCTCRITNLEELPVHEVLKAYVAEAAALNRPGAEVAKPKGAKRPPLPMPPDLKAALADKLSAKTFFESLSPSHRREYIEWITDARREHTRANRIAHTIARLLDEQPRHWDKKKSKQAGGKR